MTRNRYRIQVVAQMTGVPAATLRAWERRYGLPQPERSNSSYRLYSDRDIETIKMLKALSNQGIAPSEAVQMILQREAEESAQDDTPAQPESSSPPFKLSSSPTSKDSSLSNENAFTQSYQSIMTAVKRFDPFGLEQCIRLAMLLGSAKEIFDYVFAPSLRQIGDDWHAGHLSIAQEHLATEAIGNATRDLLRMVQPDKSAKQILLACIQDELHVLPLYGSALHFSQWGYRVVMLGVNTPPEALNYSLKSFQPDAIGLSVTQTPSQEKMERLIPKYAQACGSIPWVVGGSGAHSSKDLIEKWGGLISTRSQEEVRLMLEAQIIKSQSRSS